MQSPAASVNWQAQDAFLRSRAAEELGDHRPLRAGQYSMPAMIGRCELQAYTLLKRGSWTRSMPFFLTISTSTVSEGLYGPAAVLAALHNC